ncbi:hypothetical protein AAG570_005657 [Ranatra chinensis]|uniref:Uncharacterized protein n=1 Tax=Ranatra chinensis TaxID=642074 RepID=A0ABD0XY28_9HEMI
MLTEAAAAMIVCLSVVGCVGGDEGIFYTGGVLGSTSSKTGTGGETPGPTGQSPSSSMDDSEEDSHFGSRALNFLAIFKHLANYSSASKVAEYSPVSERTDNIMAISRKASPTQRTSTASGTEKPVNTVIRYKFNGHVYATRVVPLRVTSVAPPAATPVVQSSILIVQRTRTNCPPGQRHAGGKCRAEWRW